MSDVELILGDVTFAEEEIPEHIAVKTGHKAIVTKFVGGKRDVQMLGADHEPIAWSAWLTGDNALQRAQTLKAMNDAGLPLILSWSEYLYQVVIIEFEADFEREYQIPYQIKMEVVQDLTAPLNGDAGSSIDDLIGGDMNTCTALSSSIGNTGVSSSMSSLSSAISAVSSFASATKAQITAVLTPIAQARAQVQTLIASTENTLQSITTLGGVLPNNPLATNVAKLTSQVNAMTNQTNLVQLDSVLGRMGVNVGQIGSGVKSIQTMGGSLFDLASKYYGQVAGWVGISNANPQLKGDTNINGPQTVVIPPYDPLLNGTTIV